jgi:archaemetzincin
MTIGVLQIAQADPYVVDRVVENLNMAFPKTTCTLIKAAFSLPEETFDRKRRQYRSDVILSIVQDYAQKQKAIDRVLGITDIDIFVPPLNFVFGEARCPGKAALISLYRLRPEFYGEKPNVELFVERSTKEAVHELGHTLGVEHCPNPFCVMYFSNSIFETDRKRSLFCDKCFLKKQANVDGLE